MVARHVLDVETDASDTACGRRDWTMGSLVVSISGRQARPLRRTISSAR